MVGREEIEKQPRRNQSPNEKSRFCFEDRLLQGRHLPTLILHISLRLPARSYLDRKSNPAIILVLRLFSSDLLLFPPDVHRLPYHHRKVKGSTTTTVHHPLHRLLPSQVWIWD